VLGGTSTFREVAGVQVLRNSSYRDASSRGRRGTGSLGVNLRERASISPLKGDIRGSRPEHVFTVLNTYETPTPQGQRRGQVIRLYQTLD
jgi:hypothetical protein